MRYVRITAKPKYSKNYITADLPCTPVFHIAGQTLAGIREIPYSEVQEKPRERISLEIPDDVKTIANYAFSGLRGLRNVCFNHAAYYLGAGIFFDCPDLKTAVFAEGTEKIPLETFSGCKNLQRIQLPDSVKRINMDAFKSCTALAEISLPSALEVIEASAFWGCSSMERITLPDTLTVLDNEAFANCTGLTEVVLSASLKTLGAGTFQNCVNLKRIVIPEGVTSLPMGVFAGCRNLSHVVIPKTMRYISPYAFYKCDRLRFVEGAPMERFAYALMGTPCGWEFWPEGKKPAQFPMELLYQYAGEVSGTMLSAMGYPGFDIDKTYSFSLTDHDGVIEVRARWLNTDYPKGANEDIFLINDALEPVPNAQKLIGKDMYFSSLF